MTEQDEKFMQINDLSLDIMNIMNKEFLQYQPASPVIEFTGCKTHELNMFEDSDGEFFDALELLRWFADSYEDMSDEYTDTYTKEEYESYVTQCENLLN